MRLLAAGHLACLLVLAAPKPGDEVDLAPFGHPSVFDGQPGIEWDEPRTVHRVAAEFAGMPPAPEAVKLEYWVSNWPSAPGGGWTKIDTPWQGAWRAAQTSVSTEGNTLVFRFAPLTAAENPNARNAPGFEPAFRSTLKVRLRGVEAANLHVFGDSRWNTRRVHWRSGCEGKPPLQLKAEAYNGQVLEAGPGALTILYTEHEPGSSDRTILTIHAGSHAFGVAVDDIIERKGVYVRPFGVFLGDAAAGTDFDSFLASGRLRPGADIVSRTSREPEQTLVRASAQVPALAFTSRSGSHPLRYYPLGFTGSREKYGLDFNGNLFISKHGSKAMKEDLARMLWEGDQLYFRIATGSAADVRERERAATQSLLEGWLPLVTTRWETEGIRYEEQAYATLLEAPLDDERLRGDEPSIAFLRLHATNPGAVPVSVRVLLEISPQEALEWRDGQLLAPDGRLRAALDPSGGAIAAGGRGAAWSVALAPGETKLLDIKIPFRTMTAEDARQAVHRIRFETRLDETMHYWRRLAQMGMQLQVPDAELNRFWLAALQHILLTSEKDVSTGYSMCPCGTYDYNMFANETAIQVRLLDMRGLPGWAWRCLRPIVELQGSKPLPGRFQDTAAEFHGVRVDAEHDYTHSGYNLNHGWILWTLADHFQYSKDREWLKSVLPRMEKAADWIIRERRATMRTDHGEPVPEYGLLPAGQLEDNEDFEHWFAVNGYAYRGLRAASVAIGAIDAAAGARLAREAEAYRDDIRRAALRVMAIAPAVPLRDGSFVPTIPPRTSLHGRDLGWIRNILYGAHTLIDCGVFAPDEPEAGWILQDYEDNLFMSEESFGVPDRDWFSRGGITLQPNLVNTFTSYLARGETAQALRAFFNTFAASYYPDVAEFTEWVPTFGIGGGPFFKTSDEAAFLTWLRLMLVREDSGRLRINSGAPRSWFEAGRRIDVRDCPTAFGKLSYWTESHADAGWIDAAIELASPFEAQEIELRLRDPGGKRLTRVQVDGRSWTQFDRGRESIVLPATPGRHNIRAFY